MGACDATLVVEDARPVACPSPRPGAASRRHAASEGNQAEEKAERARLGRRGWLGSLLPRRLFPDDRAVVDLGDLIMLRSPRRQPQRFTRYRALELVPSCDFSRRGAGVTHAGEWPTHLKPSTCRRPLSIPSRNPKPGHGPARRSPSTPGWLALRGFIHGIPAVKRPVSTVHPARYSVSTVHPAGYSATYIVEISSQHKAGMMDGRSGRCWVHVQSSSCFVPTSRHHMTCTYLH